MSKGTKKVDVLDKEGLNHGNEEVFNTVCIRLLYIIFKKRVCSDFFKKLGMRCAAHRQVFVASKLATINQLNQNAGDHFRIVFEY